MRALVIYESEFGATRAVAEAIHRGLKASGQANEVEAQLTDSRDPLAAGWNDDLALLVIGAPTHARSLPTPVTRKSALDWPDRPGSILHLEPHVEAPGVREWVDATDLAGIPTAIFTTRMDMARLLAGSAAPRLARMVARAGGTVFDTPQEFLVARDGRLVEHELDHAYEWGRLLGASIPQLAAARGDSR